MATGARSVNSGRLRAYGVKLNDAIFEEVQEIEDR
jgi:hypothetical protein